ncbi:MAG: metal-dependent transcriptional regulator [Bacilli bacterium]|nr:metal-dependent transcriptional regulator [Bacilli bacterium]
MELFESAEDYLERILMLEDELGEGNVRAIDVANSFQFSRASVSVAMHRLEESGYIRFGKEKELILTDEGKKAARSVYERHQILTNFFMSLGVPAEIAEKDACKVEHDLSKETFAALKKRFQ